MDDHPVKALIEAADAAIGAEDFDRLMNFYADDATLVIRPGLLARGKDAIRRAFVAIADHFDHGLIVHQGKMIVIEGAETALVVMETLLDVPTGEGRREERREATYVFRLCEDGQWRCTVDNSYGTRLLDGPA